MPRAHRSNVVPARLTGALLVLANVSLVSSCDEHGQTLVVLSGSPGMEALGAALRVRVCNQEGVLVLDKTRTRAEAERLLPARVPLIPAGDDLTRTFGLVADLLSADGQVLARQRVLGGYQAGEAREVTANFDDACLDNLVCGPGETCRAGGCVPASTAPLAEGQVPCDPLRACSTSDCADRPVYPTGFEWVRVAEFAPGARPGTAVGNPAPDVKNQPVWQYELAEGGTGRAGEQPWHGRARKLLVWDGNFFGDTRAWVRADDRGPSVTESYFDHVQSAGIREGTAIIRWLNPTRQRVQVQLLVTLTLLPQDRGPAPANDVDVVIGHKRALTSESLFETTVAAPGQSVDVSIAPMTVTVAPEDSLFLSIWGHGDVGWITAIDRTRVRLLGYVDAGT